jgi:ornithine cyclodeaminase
MKVLLINHDEVRELLPMQECMQIMSDALKALAEGNANLPLRPIMWLPENAGALGMMPAYLGNLAAMGLKVLSIFPANHGTPYDSHQGAVLLFETKNGRLLAIIDAAEITAIRTAAVSGVATQWLARKDAKTLAVLGAGVQAWPHVEAMVHVRKMTHVRVWSRNPDRAREFVRRAAERYAFAIEPAASAKEAVIGADIICAVTAATEPILLGEWLSAGMHINAVGACVPSARELDTPAVAKSRLFVDRRESAFNEAGDFLIPKNEGAIDDHHILGELGEILLGKIKGRASSEQITLFKSLGLGVEDVAAAHHIYQKAIVNGLGNWLEFGRDAEG